MIMKTTRGAICSAPDGNNELQIYYLRLQDFLFSPPEREVTGLTDRANMEPFNTPKGFICPKFSHWEVCGRRFGRPTLRKM
jgi:hypothetical protein